MRHTQNKSCQLASNALGTPRLQEQVRKAWRSIEQRYGASSFVKGLMALRLSEPEVNALYAAALKSSGSEA
jgi:hypothetical protein